MQQQSQTGEQYTVLLMGIEGETEERREVLCRTVAECCHLPVVSVREIMTRSPAILGSDLSLDEAKDLAEHLRPVGGLVSIEKKNDFRRMTLEFQEPNSAVIALETSLLVKTQSQTWSVTGRVRNVSAEALHDVWVLIQLFGGQDDLLTFEEVPLPINPLPSQGFSPFKAIFEGSLAVKAMAIAFKNSGGKPLLAVDERRPSLRETSIQRDRKDASVPSASAEVNEQASAEEQPNPMNLETEQVNVAERPLGDQGSSSRAAVEELVDLSDIAGPSPESPLESDQDNPRESVSSPGSATLAKAEVEMIDVVFPELKPPVEYPEEHGHETPIPTPALKEASQLLREIVETETQELETEEKSAETEILPIPADTESTFSWLEEFRRCVEMYYEVHPDHFMEWVETQEREKEFEGTLHSLLAILVHSRFDQMTKPEKALENTRKVTHLILRPNVLIEEIPPMEGTKCYPGDQWKLLFYRALPRIQTIGQDILNKGHWKASELEQLIQIIPHMSPETSRRAVRWIQRLQIERLHVDFSEARILVGKALYRVAARLGVLDPQFDHYEGPNSMGDAKIQAFARMAFPENPLRIEEPMTWVGMGTTEDGGSCAPTYPRCEGCLFSGFCERHGLHLDPSEKGMRKSR